MDLVWEPFWFGLDILLITKGEVNVLEKQTNVLLVQCLLASVIFKAFRTSQKW